jgi:FtsX-like permease family protein
MKSIQHLSAYRTIGRNLIVPGGVAEQVRIAEITASAFRLARVPPRLGRPLLEDDERTGIYALMSFTVAQRRKDIGIRTALGADTGKLLRSIFSRAAGQLGAGVVLGLAIAASLDIVSGGALLGPARSVLLTIMSLLMIGVGLIAAIGPARRGLRIGEF